MAVKLPGADNTSFSAIGVQKDVLETSSKMVDVQIQQDNSYPELIDCLKMGGVMPSVSGLSDQHYPGPTDLSLNLHSLSQLNMVKRLPLPSELLEQFGLMQSNCQMGLFPEVGRAWLTIDSNIFLWSYEDGSDLAYYDGLKETILCVGLVRPKPDVFQNFIHFLLCLTTPVEIIVLGVNFSRQNDNSPLFEEMNLLPEPLFSYPTDNIHMCAFQGTHSGRLFFGGKDGAIYEFMYQAQDSWFSRKCKKVNHSSSSLSFLVPSFLSLAFSEDDAVLQIVVDNSRQILYARFEKGSIQVFDMGPKGDQMSKVTVLHQHSIVQQASEAARTIDSKNFYPIIHISAVESRESKHVHLVAVTQCGVRFYLTTNGNFGDSRPYTLALLHVRLPPGFTANASVPRPSTVHKAYFKKGFLLMAASQASDNDLVFATSHDSFAFYSQLIESHTTFSLDGIAWALDEVTEADSIKEGCDPPALVTQHRDLPRKFVFLSDRGSFVFQKPRPVDQLYKLLADHKGADNDPIKAFFMIHKAPQACAMCLILACSSSLQDRQVAEWASRAFFLYGGEPLQGGDITPQDSQMLFSRPSSVWSSTPQQPGLQPNFSNVYSPVKPVLQPLPQSSIPEVVYSGKHDSLYLYFSRILRPLWSLRLVTETTTTYQDSNIVFLLSTVTSEDLVGFLQPLLALKNFFQANQQSFLNPAISNLSKNMGGSTLSAPLDDASISLQHQRTMQREAALQERVSLSHFQQLLCHAYEMLALWKVLCDHPFQSVIASLPQELKESMQAMTFKEYIVDGKELSAGLTNALINFYLEDNAGTSTISQRLRELCPSIYRLEDEAVSKAHEIILDAKNTPNKSEKEEALLRALKLCKEICPNLDLGVMCGLFRSCGFYRGLVELCLCCAQRRDPQGLALHYYKNGEPPDDHQGMQAFIQRMKCYKHIMETMRSLMGHSLSHPQSPSVPKVPGPPPPRDPLVPEEAKLCSEQMFQLVLKTEDELFHVALYDWLIEHNQTDILLFIKSHFLESYLKRCAENTYVLDLLWKYYEKNHNFSAAARILSKLADKQGLDIDLKQRIEYLSRAIMCVKSSEIRITATGEGEFLHELEEKMEVARIQLRILEALQQKKVTLSIQEAIHNLNSNFYDVTKLYEDFAEPFDLPESKLALVHCSGIYDPALIENLWKSILEKEFVATLGNLPDTRIHMLQQKLVQLSQPYMSSEKYFPLSFVIKLLEQLTCGWSLDVSWLFGTVLSLHVPIADVLKMYHSLYCAKDACWTTSGKPLHLLSVLVLIVGRFADSPSLVPLNERRTFTTFCLDVISRYLVDLQAMDSTSSSALIKDFKSVQRKLERLP